MNLVKFEMAQDQQLQREALVQLRSDVQLDEDVDLACVEFV